MFEKIRDDACEMFFYWFRRRWYGLCKIAQGLTIAGAGEKEHKNVVNSFIECEHDFDELKKYF